MAVAVLLALALHVQGQYGVVPVTMNFDGGGGGLLRGSESEAMLTIQNRGDTPTTMALAVIGQRADWVTAPAAVTVPASGAAQVAVKVSVPADAPNGEHDAEIRIVPQGQSDGSASGGASSQVAQAFVAAVRIVVTGDQVQRVVVGQVRPYDAEQAGRWFIEVDASNGGNVQAAPRVLAGVTPELGGLASDFQGTMDSIDVGGGGRQFVDMGAMTLPVGVYEAVIDVELANGEVAGPQARSHVFEVLPAGSLQMQGSVASVAFGGGAVAAGQLVPIEVRFQNEGEQPVSATLRLVVSKAEAPVAVIDALPQQVAAGAIATFQEFFTPAEAGTYVLTGTVAFGGRTVDIGSHSIIVGGLADEEATVEGQETPAIGIAIVAVTVALAGAARRWRL